MTTQEWAAIAAKIQLAWPDKQLHPDTARFWYELLQHYPANVVANAVVELATKTPFRPHVSDICQMVASQHTSENDWLSTWHEIQDRIRRFGFTQGVDHPERLDWSSPLVEQFVRQVGWKELCQAEASDTTFESQCRNKWVSMVEKHRREVALAGAGVSTVAELSDTEFAKELKGSAL